MVEEIESPTEKLEERIHEAAEKLGEHWLKWCALMAALYAVMAAVSGLISSSYANDAMLEQIKASDQWSYYQAKSIKSLIVESEANVLKKLPGGDASAPADPRNDKYRQEEDEIKEKAGKLTEASQRHMERHETTARSVTCFQVAIALIAIVVLTRRKHILGIAAILGVAGAAFLALGMI